MIAIEGKISRRGHAGGQGHEPLRLVSGWAGRQRLVPGQEEAPVPLAIAREHLQIVIAWRGFRVQAFDARRATEAVTKLALTV